jgi:hypothetical protein
MMNEWKFKKAARIYSSGWQTNAPVGCVISIVLTFTLFAV